MNYQLNIEQHIPALKYVVPVDLGQQFILREHEHESLPQVEKLMPLRAIIWSFSADMKCEADSKGNTLLTSDYSQPIRY